MSTLTDTAAVGEWLKWFVENRYCLKVCVIDDDSDATEGLVTGAVLETSSTKKIACATGANADSILVEPVSLADLVAGETNRLCIVRGPAVIDSDKITCATDQKAGALTALAALGIIAVNSALTTWTSQTT